MNLNWFKIIIFSILSSGISRSDATNLKDITKSNSLPLSISESNAISPVLSESLIERK